MRRKSTGASRLSKSRSCNADTILLRRCAELRHRPKGQWRCHRSLVSDFPATSDGLMLTKAYMHIKDAKLRRRIVDLVEQIADYQ